MAILVRAERALAVVQVKERRRSARRLLELVEDLRQRRLRFADVVPCREQMARVEPVARALAQRIRNVGEHHPDLLGRTPHREPRPRRVLDQYARTSFHGLERVRDRLRHALRRRGAIAAGRRARMKAELPDAECRRPLELLREPVAGASPLLLVVRRRIQYIRRVHDDVFRLDSALLERRLESLDALRSNRLLVTVIFRNRGEDLQSRHSAIPRAESRHVDSAIVNRVCAEQEWHCDVW